MGKKPVLGLASLFLASVAICGCQKNTCGTCGSSSYVPSGHAWNGAPRGTTGQPGGSMAAGTNTTSPNTVGGAGSVNGFQQIGSPTMSGTGTPGAQPVGAMPMGGGTTSMTRPMGTAPSAMHGSTMTGNRPMMSGQPVNAGTAPIHTVPSGTSPTIHTIPATTAPSTIQRPLPPGSFTPDEPLPTSGAGSTSKYPASGAPVLTPPTPAELPPPVPPVPPTPPDQE